MWVAVQILQPERGTHDSPYVDTAGCPDAERRRQVLASKAIGDVFPSSGAGDFHWTFSSSPVAKAASRPRAGGLTLRREQISTASAEMAGGRSWWSSPAYRLVALLTVLYVEVVHGTSAAEFQFASFTYAASTRSPFRAMTLHA